MKVKVQVEYDIDIEYLVGEINDTILDYLGDYNLDNDKDLLDEVKLEIIRTMAVKLAEKREKPSSVSVDKTDEEKSTTCENCIHYHEDECEFYCGYFRTVFSNEDNEICAYGFEEADD